MLLVKIKTKHEMSPVKLQERVSALLEAAFMDDLESGDMDIEFRDGPVTLTDEVKSKIVTFLAEGNHTVELIDQILEGLTDDELGKLIREAHES